MLMNGWKYSKKLLKEMNRNVAEKEQGKEVINVKCKEIQYMTIYEVHEYAPYTKSENFYNKMCDYREIQKVIR